MGYLCNADSAIAVCDPNRKNPHEPIQLRRFSFSDLESATDAFSLNNLLGKGSHGSVYKAVLDGGKLTAAVKRTTAPRAGNRNTGNSNATAAENEIEILSRIRSSRIVNLIGYSVDPTERNNILLVVELMPNGSLYDLIHKRRKPPGWSTRVRFALQIAKAVQLLHGSNPPVIHRDIKSSNVLIDEKGNAKLSDFGLALRGHVEDVRVMSTPPAGTLGYLDPGYLAPGDLSAKSDVFSFGILLLELITGRRAIDVNYSPPSLVEWAIPLIKSGKHAELCDRRIGSPSDSAVSVQLGMLAARCVRSSAEKRPGMDEVVDLITDVHKRAQARVWSHLKPRVRRVEAPRRLIRADSLAEEDRTSRRPLTRSRRVSSVPVLWEMNGQGLELGLEKRTGGGDRVGRSKSAGSYSELRVGPDAVKGRAQVAVRLGRVNLSKSRSMTEESNNGGGGGGGGVDGGGGKAEEVKNPQVKELDVYPLLVNGNKESPSQHKSIEDSNL